MLQDGKDEAFGTAKFGNSTYQKGDSQEETQAHLDNKNHICLLPKVVFAQFDEEEEHDLPIEAKA